MTTASDLEFVCASKNDFAAVTEILDDAARWQVARGIDQWTPGDFSWEWIGEPLERGWTHLVRSRGALVGTVSLEETDKGIWDDEGGGEAMYVHRLAVRPEHHGKRIGRAILEWCAAQTAAHGLRSLRLDCPRDNAKLRAYYEGLGFTHRGNKKLSGDWGSYHAARYEKALA